MNQWAWACEVAGLVGFADAGDVAESPFLSTRWSVFIGVVKHHDTQRVGMGWILTMTDIWTNTCHEAAMIWQKEVVRGGTFM